jgi:hypothetical protein
VNGWTFVGTVVNAIRQAARREAIGDGQWVVLRVSDRDRIGTGQVECKTLASIETREQHETLQLHDQSRAARTLAGYESPDRPVGGRADSAGNSMVAGLARVAGSALQQAGVNARSMTSATVWSESTKF